MNRVIKRMFAIFFFCILLVSCASKDEEAGKFVEDYNKTLQEVYRTANFELLIPVAMESELRKMYPVIQALRSSNSVMLTEIKNFKIKKVKVSPDKNSARVETKEKWEYWWEERNTGRITKEKNTEKYHLIYYIVKDKGNWKVDRIKLQGD